MNDHFRPVGKPAPPRPRRPESFISSMIQSRPFSSRNLVPSQAPRIWAAVEARRVEAVEIGEDAVLVLQASHITPQDAFLSDRDRIGLLSRPSRPASHLMPDVPAIGVVAIGVGCRLPACSASPHRTCRSAAPAHLRSAPCSRDRRLRAHRRHPCARSALTRRARLPSTRFAGVSAASRLGRPAGIAALRPSASDGSGCSRAAASPVSAAFTASSSKRLRHAPISEPS